MAKLGTSLSNSFHIGNAEIRIGNLSAANKLTQLNSVGLLQSANVSFQQESVDLEGGLPKTLIDTVITKTNVTVVAQAYEYSKKNIRVMLNEGIQGATTDLPDDTTVLTAATISTSANATLEISQVFASNVLAAGDLLVVYNIDTSTGSKKPEEMSVIRVDSVAASTVNVTGGAKTKVTYDGSKYPLLFNAVVGAVVFKANQIGVGNSSATNYFSLDVIGQDHATGHPKGFRFWKAAISGGLEYSFSNDNFAVTPMSFKILQPGLAEYDTGGALVHLKDIIPSHPYGMAF
jgi:hypothetical protein